MELHEFHTDVNEFLCEWLEMTYSDASGITMLHEALIEECYDNGISVKETAEEIETASQASTN